MRQLLAIATIIGLLTAGCLGTDNELQPANEGPDPVHVPVTVHLVNVGVAADALDEAALLAELPGERMPLVESVTGSVGVVEYLPTHHMFSYQIHDATPAFEEGFFATAMANAHEGRPNTWLAEYDRTGPQRICGACTGVAALDALTGNGPADILYLDAMPTERWVLENLDLLDFEVAEGDLVILLIDGENAGAFPSDTYHYWRFDDGAAHSKVPKEGLAAAAEPPVEAFEEGHVAPFHTPKETITMRAWGGNGNVLWLDLTGAPSAYDIMPRRGISDARDPPLWELKGKPAEAAANVGKNLADFIQLRVARDAIYPTHAFERFVSPIHVFVEEGAMENPQNPLGVDLEKWVPADDIHRSLERLMPWVEIDAPVMFHYLPQDDLGMTEAIKRAKAYGNPTTVDSGVIKHHIRTHWDEYVPEAGPGDFVIPQFYYFFNGPYTFWGVSSAGGWADGDAEAKPWAIIDHFFDLCVRPDVWPCMKGTIGFQNLSILPLHEAGHELGLTHTKDTTDLDEESWTQWKVNWLWDSQFSMMSYRHVYMQFDHWDQRFIALAHATDLIHRTEEMGGDASDARALIAAGHMRDAVAQAWRDLRAAQADQLQTSAADPGIVEDVTELQLEVLASSSVLSGTNLGIQYVPAPAILPADVTCASTTFDVPEDAKQVRIHYRDVMPAGVGPYKSSFAVVLGPDDSYRGGLFESYEDEAILKSHWRGAGEHTLWLCQPSGTTGLYDVTIGIA